MNSNFLDILDKVGSATDDSGDHHGGAGGKDGSGLPTGAPGNFMFATGIECSNPTVKNGTVRRDQLEECGHYKHWRDDLYLVCELGLKVLRYGLPIHKTFLGPGKYDWSFADEVMREMQRLRITPILDLLHFGVPDWLGNFQNPELPIHFADYAEAVAQRYPWVRYYTPVNEIYVTARLSGKDGVWNEQLKDDRALHHRAQTRRGREPSSPPTASPSTGPIASSYRANPPNTCTKPARRRRSRLRSTISSACFPWICSTRTRRTPMFSSTFRTTDSRARNTTGS